MPPGQQGGIHLRDEIGLGRFQLGAINFYESKKPVLTPMVRPPQPIQFTCGNLLPKSSGMGTTWLSL